MPSTLSYSPSNEGWPSFYSFQPEHMVGMNGVFYSFDGGNIWQHNSNETRNNFYGEQYSSSVQGVFNDAPFERKLFQTISTHSTSAWDTVLNTDLQAGFVATSMFNRKELVWYGFVRAYAAELDFLMRRAGGLGTIEVPGSPGAIYEVELTTEYDDIVSIGDYVYYGLGSPPTYAGTVSSFVSANVIAINSTVSAPDGSVAVIPDAADIGKLMLYIKNSTAESHGVLGNYCVFTLTNSDTAPTELFAADTEVMKSFS
jgi:hypothetical protein